MMVRATFQGLNPPSSGSNSVWMHDVRLLGGEGTAIGSPLQPAQRKWCHFVLSVPCCMHVAVWKTGRPARSFPTHMYIRIASTITCAMIDAYPWLRLHRVWTRLSVPIGSTTTMRSCIQSRDSRTLLPHTTLHGPLQCSSANLKNSSKNSGDVVRGAVSLAVRTQVSSTVLPSGEACDTLSSLRTYLDRRHPEDSSKHIRTSRTVTTCPTWARFTAAASSSPSAACVTILKLWPQ
mmetsp:Transcript_13517/g.26713  ORF Transcript_13517/g.26713 Transcript_13517/m.26713 type:complete len:235 (+) Transcript_13517:175-879(+)